MIVRNCELRLPGKLEECLQSLRRITPKAEIVIVDTMSKDTTIEVAQRYADVFEQYKGPRGDWTREMAAFDDAAAARNKSFELAHGEWLAWIDADDVLLTPEEAEQMLRAHHRWQPGAKSGAEIIREAGGENFIEAALQRMDKEHPEIDAVFCPYAYQVAPDGTVKVWQDRERFIRSTAGYVWRSAAHEICVPAKPSHKRPVYFAHCLFKHQKVFSPEEAAYSIGRHGKIMLADFEANKDRTTRTSLYLASFSHQLYPWRTWEFLEQAYASAITPLDRYRALVAIAGEEFLEGRVRDAYEHVAAAIQHKPNLPDAYYLGACIAESAEEWQKAADWFVEAASKEIGHVESNVPPRDQSPGGPLRAAMCCWRMSKVANNAGDWAACCRHLEEAGKIAQKLLADPALAHDRVEVGVLHVFWQNELAGLKYLLALQGLHEYLRVNDETQKALHVHEVIPHNLRDHPIAQELEASGGLVRRHMTDDKAYRAHYDKDSETGAIPTPLETLWGPFEKMQPRICWLAQQVRQQVETGARSIIEIGCFDGGFSGIPVMRAANEAAEKLSVEAYVKYTGIDTQQSKLDDFARRLLTGPKLEGMEPVSLICASKLEAGLSADIVVANEIIEHVPDPVAFVGSLLAAVNPGGRLFLSTPWGSYDKGNPLEATKPRDPRGHLRAMMPRDLVEVVEKAGGKVVDLGVAPVGFGPIGAEMFCSVEKVACCYEASVKPKAVTFVVPSALWDWNATHVKQTGIGASEETIVFLAEELAKGDLQAVEVFGPLPYAGVVRLEEVSARVPYWPVENLGRLKGRQKVVVSRAPSFGLQLEQVKGPLDMVLWLQDAIYGDLSPQVAEHYSKIVVLSEWHKQAMHERHGVPLEKMVVIPNFLLKEHFLQQDVKRERHHFIYSSSPDRGLLMLLKMWPQILDRWPDATLDVFYGWDGCKKLAAINPAWATSYEQLWKEWRELRYQKGVTDRGRVNHVTIAREMLRADVWCQTTDFEETFCSNAIKARAAGAVPVTHPIAALAETAVCPQAVIYDRRGAEEPFEAYRARTLMALEKAFDISDDERRKMMDEAIEKYRIEQVMPLWREVLR